MTSELEQKFYDTFEIEPLSKWHKCKDYSCIYCDEYEFCSREEFIYPRITAEKLLEMICIILNAEGLLTINTEGNIADIKDFVLRFLIGKVSKNNPYCHYKTKNKIKHQIQQLFKEEERTI